MRYVSINSVPNGSTGTVMRQVSDERVDLGDECWLMWGRGRAAENDHEYNYGSKLGLYLDVAQTRLDGMAGFHSKVATRRLLAKLDEIDPDVVHLHNIHGYHVNVEMLFEWLANHRCHVNWTLHDCWAFTGHCSYFTYVKCEQWRTHCSYLEKCSQLGEYPRTFAGSASCRKSFERKRAAFALLDPGRMTIYTPSHWLKGLVAESYLSKYPVVVRNNSVDTDVFRPTPSDFRERCGIGDRFMVLGVASPWSERKGLSDLVRLAGELDPARFAVVIVGLSGEQVRRLRETRVVALPRASSARELAEIYTAADVLYNPTREDNFPTVNLEAEACGTPVVTYHVGGCPETIHMPESRVAKDFNEAKEMLALMDDSR